jgi:hypothetical protein
MELSCRSLAPPSSSTVPLSSEGADEPEYEIYYTGGTVTPTKDGGQGQGRVEFFLDPGKGIHIEARWRRARPGLKKSKGKGLPKAMNRQTLEDADLDTVTVAETDPTTDGKADGKGKKDGFGTTWSWYMKFFVPIPMGMFCGGREDVMFRVRAKAWVVLGDQGEREMIVEKEMSVSCLRWKKVVFGTRTGG